jgi:hypothetical protein
MKIDVEYVEHQVSNFYEVYREGIEEDLASLRELGLTRHAEAYEYIINAPCSVENLRIYADLVFPEALGGYQRTNVVQSQLSQIADPPPYPEIPPMLRALQEEGTRLVEDIINDGGFMTAAEAREFASNYMTTKGAASGSVHVEVELNGKIVRYTTRDKVTHLLTSPEDHFTDEAFNNALTLDNPGKPGARQVPGRNTRLIFPIPLPLYLIEFVFADAMYRQQLRDAEFTLSRTTGSVIRDHYPAFESTTMERIIQFLADFSQYDSSIRHHIRGPFFAGMTMASQDRMPWDQTGKERGMRSKKSYLAILGDLWLIKYREAVYQIGEQKVILDQELSGENSTLGLNNSVNRSFSNHFWQSLPALLALAFTLKDREFMGDDSKARVNSIPKPSVEQIRGFLNHLKEVSETNGFSININKTGFTPYFYEYLKVTVICGHNVPRKQQLQFYQKEKLANDTSDTINLARGLFGFAQTWVARGGVAQHAFKFVKKVWIFLRHFTGGEIGNNVMGKYPYCTLYVPDKGIGMSLWGNDYLANSAAANLIMMPEHWRKPIADCMEMLSSVSLNTRKEIADILVKNKDEPHMRGETKVFTNFSRGIKFMQDNIDPDRRQVAHRANQILLSRGIDVGNLFIDRLPETSARLSIKQSPNFVGLDTIGRGRVAKSLKSFRPSRNSTIFKHRPYLEGISAEFGDLVEVVAPGEVIVGVDDEISLLQRTVGYGGDSESNFFEMASVFSKLRADKSFPRVVSHTEIADFIFRNKMFNRDEIALSFLAMGVAPNIAMITADRIVRSIDMVYFSATAGGFSFNGDITRELNATMINAVRS